MILYNVTVSIDPEIHDEWVQWMKTKHLPDVMATGLFLENRMLRLLSQAPDESGPTYAFQYVCRDQETLERYQKEFAPALQEEHTERYKGKFVAFRTILEYV